MYMTGGLGPGIFWDTQKNKYQEKSDPKNKFMKITDPKKISPLCNLCDSCKLSVVHFLSKFQESGDESLGRVLLSSFINNIVC